MCIWQFIEDESAELVEPELVCECEVASNVMDLIFLDEQRVVASFSNGCVALFRYRSMQKVIAPRDRNLFSSIVQFCVWYRVVTITSYDACVLYDRRGIPL